MISLEQFHENIWKLFFNRKKTLDEALEAFEMMTIESKTLISMMAFRIKKSELINIQNGNTPFSLKMDPEEIEYFSLLFKQKEKEGFFDKEISEAEMFEIIMNGNTE